MIFDKESDFEEALIVVLQQHGWGSGEVIKYPTEQDLIDNWARILYQNNADIDRLNGCPLTDGEMKQILDQIKTLKTPIALNGFINGKSVAIKRDNPDDQLHLGKEVSLKIYDRHEIAAGQSRYQIVQQPQYAAKNKILGDRRGDLCLLINGMPVIHIELKKSGIPISQACNQIEKYAHEGVFTGIFSLVQIFVAMNPDDAVYFANTGTDQFNKKFFFHWEDFNNEPICAGKKVGHDEWKDFASMLLSIPMAHQLIGFYTIADSNEGILKVLRSYQYYAVSAISDRVSECKWNEPTPTDTAGRLGGFIWHTTGSGKTMTSFKAAQFIADSKAADKVVFLMDRIELGTQSLSEYRSFADSKDSVQGTENTVELRNKLIDSSDPKDTLIVTSIQKMYRIKSDDGGITQSELDRVAKKRLVFIIDECHRSTFGDMLRGIRQSFPNALFFGFTGTPILDKNKKKNSMTTDLFGDCLHRYTIADGIRDGNVLGFDTYMVSTYKEKDLRVAIGLEKAKAKDISEVHADPDKQKIFDHYMNKKEVPMACPEPSDDEVKAHKKKKEESIEDLIPSSQYGIKTDHPQKVLDDIKEQFEILSHGNKFHAILATHSIVEAINYYHLFKEQQPQIKCTALFDPNYDQNGDDVIDKEDAMLELIEDYNRAYNKQFSLQKWDFMKKDISARLSHKGPYQGIKPNDDNRLDLLIVVDQMLTGFDSKWVNTLYLDKFIAYESLIQAFSRTNRLFGPDKPFGIIRYYRKPYTMKNNIAAAVKLYSGDKPLDLFVQKLPQNIASMNKKYREIKELFESNRISNFEKLPEDIKARQKFAKDFILLNEYLNAAIVQGFTFEKLEYRIATEEGKRVTVTSELDGRTYRILLKRYKELFEGGTGGGEADADPPYDIEGYLTEIGSDAIDADYMNSNFDKWLKALNSGDPNLQMINQELHRSFAFLPQDYQLEAEIILHEIQRGDLKVEEGCYLRDLITSRLRKKSDSLTDKLVNAFGIDKNLLVEIKMQAIDENNINEYGRFDNLISTVDKGKAKAFFEQKEGTNISQLKVNIWIAALLRQFI